MRPADLLISSATTATRRAAAPAPLRIPTQAPATRAVLGKITPLCITWDIAVEAIRRSPPAAALLNGHAPKLLSARLELRITPELAASPTLTPAAASFQKADEVAQVRLAADLVLTLRDDSVDIFPLILDQSASVYAFGAQLALDLPACTLSIELSSLAGEPARLLYARTTLLTEKLGLPGGVYDAPELAPLFSSPTPMLRR